MQHPLRMALLTLAVVLVVIARPSLGAETTSSELADRIDQLQKNLDFVWVMLAAALVFLMQAGFMCFESGMARTKNSINVAIKNMADFLVAVIAFWLLGFGLMFGTSYMGLFGCSNFFMRPGSNAWLAAFFVFQAVLVNLLGRQRE